MLRITRLHLLIAFIGVICLGVGLFNWYRQSEPSVPVSVPKPNTLIPQMPPSAATHPPADQAEAAARMVATVGEAYKPLHQRYGDIPPVSRPLRAAKQQLAEGHADRALGSARESWLALKAFRAKARPAEGIYQVRRGDTLWRIAEAHSPARAGAGWVTIWKANQDRVSDFNKLEVGWTLNIPPQRQQYEMPFWKPH
jgi:nucleoid-associated protein YgaU